MKAVDRPVAQPVRSETPSFRPQWIPVVVRSVKPASGEMYFHRLRYADKPPVVGNYVAFGRLERGYPLPTLTYTDYAAFVWPETMQQDGQDVDNPITTETMPLLATQQRG